MTADSTASFRQRVPTPQAVTELREIPNAVNISQGNRLASFCLARRTIGICLLLIVVVLWTTSNFLASTIFADDTYSKPFFVTYVNTSLFILPLLAIVFARVWRLWRSNKLAQVDSLASVLRLIDSYDPKDAEGEYDWDVSSSDEEDYESGHGHGHEHEYEYGREQSRQLGIRATARLSIRFCMLWFIANYFAMACLQYTTVGSTTILTSTSGVWTLIFGGIMRIERFTIRKLIGVLASVVGVILISRVDISSTPPAGNGNNGGSGSGSGSGDDNNPSFPPKSAPEIALGDAMAAFSAVMYGVYTIVMKRQVGDESKVNMPLFFGLVGFFNLVLLWPGFIVLHLSGLEEFEIPGSGEVWGIVLINALTSVTSDLCWAYSMLLTTPLVVTVGLSLTIPLSLVGQMFLQAYYASALYWVGAMIVVLSFVIVNHESGRESDVVVAAVGAAGGGDSDVDGTKLVPSASTTAAGGYEVVPGRDEEVVGVVGDGDGGERVVVEERC